MSIPRLTPERAATVDGLAKRDEALCPAMTSSHQLRILDLLDQLRDTTARAEQAEMDRDALSALAEFYGELVRRQTLVVPGTLDDETLDKDNDKLTELLIQASAALKRAKGGA